MSAELIAIPTRVEDMDLAWFQAILKEPVVAARIVEVIRGAATKVKVDLDLARPGGAPRRGTVRVKTGLEPHSNSIGTEKVYAGETFFYRNYGGRFERRTFDSPFADSDGDGNCVIVLDDLRRLGAAIVERASAAAMGFGALGILLGGA